MNLSEQVAIVTGGSRGIGRAICIALANEGATVIAAARGVEKTRAWAADLPDISDRIIPTALDVTDGGAIDEVVNNTAEKHGRIDILVNNAGLTRDGLLMSMSDEQFDEVIDTTITSGFA